MRYRLINYTEVEPIEDTSAGQGKWAVASIEKTDNYFDFTEKDTAKDVLKALKESGAIDTVDRKKVFISDVTHSLIEVKYKKGMKPICRLERSVL